MIPASAGEAGARSRRGFELFDAAVDDMVGLALEAGADVICTASSDRDDPVADHFANRCARLGQPFVDAVARTTLASEELLGRNSAGHWSPEGHREVARALARTVVER